MTTFDDRENAYEAKFAHDADTEFRVTARRNKLLGQWAAGLLHLTPAETDAYAKSVVQADFEESGDEDVIRKLLGDLTRGGVAIDEPAVRAKIAELAGEAAKQVRG